VLTLTNEFKLILDRRQIEVIENTLIACRSVWNFALRERKDWFVSRPSSVNACSLEREYIILDDALYLNDYNQDKALIFAQKNSEKIQSTNAQVLQQVLRTLDRAFADMQSKKLELPRFKNQYRVCSFVYPQMLKDCVQANQIKLPQIGWVKLRKSREIPDEFEVKQARIMRRAFSYLVTHSLPLNVNIPEVVFHGHSIGIDFDNVLGHSVSQNVCRDDLAGAVTPSQESVKQKILNVNLRISRITATIGA
jgi:putative transposase